MAKFRYVGPYAAVDVPELERYEANAVKHGEVVEVPDDRVDGYACQLDNWEPVKTTRADKNEVTS